MRMRSEAATGFIRTAMPACCFVRGTRSGLTSPNESGGGGGAFPVPGFAGDELGERFPHAIGGSDVARKANLLRGHDFLQPGCVGRALKQRAIEPRTALGIAEVGVSDEQKREQGRSCDGKIAENGHCLSDPLLGNEDAPLAIKAGFKPRKCLRGRLSAGWWLM